MAEINIEAITQGTLNGEGSFDKLMRTYNAQLGEQFSQSRISATDFAKVYSVALDSAAAQTFNFELQRQVADKQAELLAAQKTILDLQVTGTELDNDLKRKALEKADADIAMVIQQTENAVQIGRNLVTQNVKLVNEISYLITQESKVLQDIKVGQQQVSSMQRTDAKTIADTNLTNQQTTNAVQTGNLIVKQQTKIESETSLLNRKEMTEQAQTKDNVNHPTGGDYGVAGMIGKQKDLIVVQKDGFLRNAEQKALKMFSDIWSVRRSTDPTTTPVAETGMTDTDLKQLADKAKASVLNPPNL